MEKQSKLQRQKVLGLVRQDSAVGIGGDWYQNDFMMNEQLARTRLLLGDAALEKLAAARVAVFGIGGVGGYAVEALVRSGIGALDLIDSDKVDMTNLNRQILATHKTIGQYKVDAAAERIKEINPDCKVKTYKMFFLPETAAQFDFKQYDYVIDAIDTVSGKIGLAVAANAAGVPIISAMGAGNKLDAAAFEVADIYKTSVCPLAHVMRKELKKREIKKLKVVYSKEQPLQPVEKAAEGARRQVPGSVAFVPAAAGMILAGEVIKDLAGL